MSQEEMVELNAELAALQKQRSAAAARRRELAERKLRRPAPTAEELADIGTEMAQVTELIELIDGDAAAANLRLRAVRDSLASRTTDAPTTNTTVASVIHAASSVSSSSSTTMDTRVDEKDANDSEPRTTARPPNPQHARRPNSRRHFTDEDDESEPEDDSSDPDITFRNNKADYIVPTDIPKMQPHAPGFDWTTWFAQFCARCCAHNLPITQWARVLYSCVEDPLVIREIFNSKNGRRRRFVKMMAALVRAYRPTDFALTAADKLLKARWRPHHRGLDVFNSEFREWARTTRGVDMNDSVLAFQLYLHALPADLAQRALVQYHNSHPLQVNERIRLTADFSPALLQFRKYDVNLLMQHALDIYSVMQHASQSSLREQHDHRDRPDHRDRDHHYSITHQPTLSRSNSHNSLTARLATPSPHSMPPRQATSSSSHSSYSGAHSGGAQSGGVVHSSGQRHSHNSSSSSFGDGRMAKSSNMVIDTRTDERLTESHICSLGVNYIMPPQRSGTPIHDDALPFVLRSDNLDTSEEDAVASYMPPLPDDGDQSDYDLDDSDSDHPVDNTITIPPEHALKFQKSLSSMLYAFFIEMRAVNRRKGHPLEVEDDREAWKHFFMESKIYAEGFF